MAVMPIRSLWSSETVRPCRWASRLTTNRPIRRAVSGVTSPPERSFSLSSASASSAMPSPASVTWTMTPPRVNDEVTITFELGGRVRQGVVDQLGQQVHHVGGGLAADPLGGCGVELHAAVVLHTRDGGLEDVGQGEVVLLGGPGRAHRRG